MSATVSELSVAITANTDDFDAKIDRVMARLQELSDAYEKLDVDRLDRLYKDLETLKRQGRLT